MSQPNPFVLAIQNRIGAPVGMRTGTVVSVDTITTITMSIGGATLPDIPYLNSYSPTAGDVAMCLFQGGSILCLGKVGA